MMFFFLDGSALAKRYIAEQGTQLVDALIDNLAGNRLIVLSIGFAEVVSVLVRRKNAGLLSITSFGHGILHLSKEIIHAQTISKVEATNTLVIAALMHIPKHAINATDAIVLHAALGLAQDFRTRRDDLVLVASDQRLLRAAQAEGLNTFNPELQDQAALTALMGNAVKDFYAAVLQSNRFSFLLSSGLSRRIAGSPSGFLSGFGGR
jgi:predicted nucleic acid-binding protein